MAIRHSITLSTSEPNNEVGNLKIRQGDEQTQTLEVQITADGVPMSFVGYQPFFCAKLGQTAGLGIVEQKITGTMNPANGTLEYVMRPEDWQKVGRQIGYFAFRKMKNDHEWTEQFTTRDFTYNVIPSVTGEIREVKKDGSTYVWTIEDMLRLFKEYIATGKIEWENYKNDERTIWETYRLAEKINWDDYKLREKNEWKNYKDDEKTTWEKFVEDNREFLENADPGGKIILELLGGRGGFDSLGERLDGEHAEITTQLAQTEQTFATQLLDTAKKSDIGSPLTASSVSEMTDVTRVYVNTTDGKWYTHNGTGWVSGGLYNSQAIADKSITPIKNSYPTIQGTYSLNKNKFDKSTAIHGKYFDHTSGALLEYPDRFLSQKIAVKVGEKYRKTYGHAVALYGKNDNFVLGLSNADESVIVIPTGVTYALLTGLITEMETAMFFTGETLPPYESGLPKLPPELIADGSITAKKVNFPVLETQESTNIADLSLAIDGYYVDYTNGLLQPAVGFTAVRFLKVSPNKTYIKSYGQQMAFYARESEDSYISGQASGEMFTTPPKCSFVGVTIENDYLDTYRINEGDTLLPFETYGDKISEKNIPMSVLKTSEKPANIVSIAKEGGDFSKPSDALLNVSDSIENPITLQIAPGVYSDSLNGWGRYVSVIGVDREHCVIKNDLNDYYRPPVDAAPNNVYKNLTIHAQATASTETNEMPAYGVHFDLSGRGLDLDDAKHQGTCLFENCNIFSEYSHGLGAGLSKKTKLVFRNCDFYSPRLNALRIHGYMPAELATEQNAEFINCRFWNDGSLEPIVLQDPNMTNPDTFDTTFTFQNCVAWNENGQVNLLAVQQAPKTSDDVVGNIKLGKGSFGNNISALNK